MEKKIRDIFRTGITRSVEHREKCLRRLRHEILRLEPEILEALHQDLRKPEFESRATETGFVVIEINHVLDHLDRWTQPIDGIAPLTAQPATTRIIPSPKGTVLIISPWNYPFQLAMAPLIAAIAAGNTVVLKPSELTPTVANVIKKIIDATFPDGEVQCVLGGPEAAAELLKEPFNHFFFTGSTRIGKIVAHAAAEQLASATLELGGKSPCVIHPTADITLSARRIAWGKALNAGQTCVAPDYLLVHSKIHDALVDAIKSEWRNFYGNSPMNSRDYGRIVNHPHFDRLEQILKSTKGTVHGGSTDRLQKFIEPTLITGVDSDDTSMAEEIFGPILPVMTWNEESDLERIIEQNPDPLAFYVFSGDQKFSERLLSNYSFGGGCVNHTVHHVACPDLPFGGIRASGSGQYHGKFGFDTFTHYKGILNAATLFDVKLGYPPYNDRARLLTWLYR